MPTDFPPHDPNFPDVDPVTGDERETEPDADELNHRYDPVD